MTLGTDHSHWPVLLMQGNLAVLGTKRHKSLMRLCGDLDESASAWKTQKSPNAAGGDPSGLAARTYPPRAAHLGKIKQGRLGGKSKMSPIKLLNKSLFKYIP